MTNHYQVLESEKYYTASLIEDHKLARRQSRKSFASGIFNLVMAGLICAATYYAILHMPTWLPVAQEWFHQATNYRYK